MANKRILKRNINHICSELFAECATIAYSKKSVDQEQLDDLMRRILLLQTDFISRIAHPEPGKTKESFKKLQADFLAQVQQLVDDITKVA